MWYVIQVMTGDEEKTLELCKERIPESFYHEIFIPRYQCKKKYQGQWHQEERILFPGYLFIDAEEIEPIILKLRHIDGLTKVLGDGNAPVPIDKEEQSYLQGMMDSRYVVRISVGYIIGERIEITSGPLKEYPAIIRRIDRHKRMAEIDVELFGRYTRVQVGLEIVRKVEVGGCIQ